MRNVKFCSSLPRTLEECPRTCPLLSAPYSWKLLAVKVLRHLALWFGLWLGARVRQRSSGSVCIQALRNLCSGEVDSFCPTASHVQVGLGAAVQRKHTAHRASVQTARPGCTGPQGLPRGLHQLATPNRRLTGQYSVMASLGAQPPLR